MAKFYTDVRRLGKNLLVRYYDDRYKTPQFDKINYQPTVFVTSKKPSQWKTLDGKNVEPIMPGNMWETGEFIEKYKSVANFTVYGNDRYVHTYITEEFDEEIQYDESKITRCNIDIEVASEHGFPEPALASEEIVSITLKIGKIFYALGLNGHFKTDRKDVAYFRFTDEKNLLRAFISLMESKKPDIITGWHINGFDIPYLIRRAKNLGMENEMKCISPWKHIQEKIDKESGEARYQIYGMAILDYIELYKKFNLKKRESYKLDYICEVELGEKKLDYSEHGSLHRLYKENFQKFMDYNIRDVELVEKLDDKKKFIELAIVLALMTKVNFEDVFQQTRMWDSIIYDYLYRKKIVYPIASMAGVKTEKFEGAFVKAPQIGKFPWIVSFDATSLYPSIMMMLNVGPDTIINQKLLDVDIEDMVETRQNPHQTMLQDNDWCMGANGACFRNDIKGFLPTIVEHVFNKRQAYKAKMLDAERQYKETGDDKWKAVESRYNTMQSATKVSANSAYGVMGSPHFRFFDTRVAEAVTKTGQLIITWAADTLNRYLNELGGTTGKDFVIMADTDSVYVNLSSFVPKDIKDPQLIADFLSGVEVTKGKREGGFVREHINPLFAKTFDELKAQINAKVQKIHMKQESVVLSGIFVAKKKYCMAVIESEGGLRKDKPDTVVKGIELVRSDTPILCKSSMKKAIDIMLLGKEDDLHELVADFYQKFKVAPYQDISYPTGINGLTDYKGEGDAIYAKGCPIHVRAALLHNYYVKKKGLSREYQPIRDKDKIKYVYLKMPNPFAENVIGYADAIPKEFDLEKYIDRILMFDKSFINPIKRVTDAFGWTPEPVNSLF